MQAESELAEAMASLRKETDRVTHIESTITNIQASFSDKLKKKSALESHIGVLNGNLERAEQLAYSLEEEHRKWQEQLLATEKRLSCLVGDCLIGGMVIAYGGQFDFQREKVQLTHGKISVSSLEFQSVNWVSWRCLSQSLKDHI